MQSLLNKSIKILPCSPSELGNLQSAILFMLSAATAIIAQKKKKKWNIRYVDTFCCNTKIELQCA